MQFLEAVTPPVSFPVENATQHKWYIPLTCSALHTSMGNHALRTASNETLVDFEWTGHFCGPRAVPRAEEQRNHLICPLLRVDFCDGRVDSVMEVPDPMSGEQIFPLPQV